jgi:hypothetical protein
MQLPDGTDSDEISLENDRHGGIGLCDPELSQRRRDMLDLVNRLHSTGSVIIAKI